ncbi:zinc finger A20 and AN1 domain-containing stress-associated protein 8-like [Iris pallida]|uniref:Zinc finger A20 and AN1 domain-containing stress-associated protein 8-like n=1 Tax=Iris pallida TaxID=29817 RepID=A0AAX6FBD1_IRIPA|nr:zinc finger A20 and AN1 domain-containing stress-associated protein 8-like [Iris pallida]
MDPDVPILCANNCGFFGNPSTNNLCSKCYKDSSLTNSKAQIEFAPVPKISTEVEEEEEEGEEKEGEVSSSSSGGAKEKPKNRCSFCNKKVGLTGFKCRCGDLFCSLHRYSDEHRCVFDYRGQGRDAIAKANPIVKADKMEKI